MRVAWPGMGDISAHRCPRCARQLDVQMEVDDDSRVTNAFDRSIPDFPGFCMNCKTFFVIDARGSREATVHEVTSILVTFPEIRDLIFSDLEASQSLDPERIAGLRALLEQASEQYAGQPRRRRRRR